MTGYIKKFSKINEENLPAATVIVAARNEEDNILECMESLDALIYPSGKLEIIIVNDHSDDRTGEIIDEFIRGKEEFKSMIPEKQIGQVKGKANAIANAVEIATGDIILTTDADCTVSPTWAKTIASYYEDDVAFVGGYTTQSGDTIFEGMQAADFVFLLGAAAGSVNLKFPLSCIGNNMSYRKSAYEEVGGYAGIDFSVTEDFSLLRAIKNLKKYKILYPLDKDALVTSKPCPDFKSIYWQKKRWGVGGKESEPFGFLVMGTAFLTHLSILLSPFFFSLTALYFVLFKIFVDYFFIYPLFKSLDLKLKVKNFIAFELYFIIYSLVLPFVIVKSNVKWKGREY